MGDISRRFEQIITKTQKKFLDQGTVLPVKTANGIQVGCALITCDGPYKNLYRQDKIIFENVCLNQVAIKLANLIAWNKITPNAWDIYRADQEYNRYFVDSTMLLASYHMALRSEDYFRADVLWARYSESKGNASKAKLKAERMSSMK